MAAGEARRPGLGQPVPPCASAKPARVPDDVHGRHEGGVPRSGAGAIKAMCRRRRWIITMVTTRRGVSSAGQPPVRVPCASASRRGRWTTLGGRHRGRGVPRRACCATARPGKVSAGAGPPPMAATRARRPGLGPAGATRALLQSGAGATVAHGHHEGAASRASASRCATMRFAAGAGADHRHGRHEGAASRARWPVPPCFVPARRADHHGRYRGQHPALARGCHHAPRKAGAGAITAHGRHEGAASRLGQPPPCAS